MKIKAKFFAYFRDGAGGFYFAAEDSSGLVKNVSFFKDPSILLRPSLMFFMELL